MILLWGITGDGPMDLVRETLTRRQVPFVFLDHKQTWQTRARIQYYPFLSGEITCGNQRIALENVSAAYFRPYDFRMYPDYHYDTGDWENPMASYAMNLEDLLWSWAEITPQLVLNKSSKMISNNSKPYQLEVIRSVGLAIPATILTTSREFVRQFQQNHESLIYKSVSGTRSIVSKLEEEKSRELDNVRWCPTQFQDFIEGYNCRVHVVKDRIFGHKVLSEAADYRYDDSRIEATTLPVAIQAKCLRLSKELELPLCGIDFKVTPEGEWVCFEVNPSPAFSYYQEQTGQEISEAIVDFLTD